MSNTTVTIGGKEYVYQGVTDLEVAPLAEVFGTERPEEGTKEYRDWEKQFMRKFADYSSQRAIAFFLLCAFPDLPESIVKYTVRRMPDGTEECKPGRDLRVKLEAKDFEQIVLIISSELKKIEEKLKQNDNLLKHRTYPDVIRTSHIVQDTSNSNQPLSSEEITSVVQEVLRQRQFTN
ncbi:hypothetical protein [Microcoleus sp. Pol12B5]|uniref:hypothetical protein n=1 Tax=Microcoleus sp. Pol12B5 TaxID=3055396 RepID=UPI002FD0E327